MVGVNHAWQWIPSVAALLFLAAIVAGIL